MSGKVAVVATPGGHVDEAIEIAGRFAERDDRFWITARTPQTESNLASEETVWVRDVKARQGLRAARSFVPALRLMRERRPRLVVSTGAALTVPYMVAARLLRIPVTFVESATRLIGPSQTGRIIERWPGVHLYHQGQDWERPGWSEFGSVFDDYSVIEVAERPVRQVLVTVGSEKFPFVRALESVRDGLPGVHRVWQTGNTAVGGMRLPGEARAWWSGAELAAAAKASDAVVTHAGVGSILMVLRTGACPVVIPRTVDLGEHVDDHQVDLAGRLESRGLVIVARPGDDIADRVREASARRVVRSA